MQADERRRLASEARAAGYDVPENFLIGTGAVSKHADDQLAAVLQRNRESVHRTCIYPIHTQHLEMRWANWPSACKQALGCIRKQRISKALA